MTPCDGTPTSETWCCRLDNTTCCNSDSAINIPAQFGKQAASATTGVPTATNTNSPSSSSSNGLSDGAKAGIGVGVAVGAIGIFAILAFWILRQRRQLKQQQEQQSKIGEFNMAKVVAGSGYQGYATVQSPGPSPGEMNGQGMAHEKAAGAEDTRHELHAEPSRRR